MRFGETWRPVVRAGAWLGVVDGISAVVINVLRSPTATFARTFQGVAYAVLGKDTFEEGAASTLLGLAMHVTVAFAWVTVCFLAFHWLPRVRRLACGRFGVAVVGVPFGASIWLTMTVIVFPLTRIGAHAPFTSAGYLINFVHHMLVVGPLVVALLRRPLDDVTSTRR